ncbi:MAG: flagellar biosynthetic protein FliO [Phycisphaerae bacterium]|jgi:flagellar biogenesis protein FliO
MKVRLNKTAKTFKSLALYTAALLLVWQGLTFAAEPNAPAAPAKQNIITAREPNFAIGQNQRIETGEIYWRMMLAILLVIILGSAAYYVSKKLGSRIVNQPNRRMKLVETLYLGSKKSLHLIKIGQREIIVATTPTAISSIADLGTIKETPFQEQQ